MSLTWETLFKTRSSRSAFVHGAVLLLKTNVPPYHFSLTVMDALQAELDRLEENDRYRSACMKALRYLGDQHDILPSSFRCRGVVREGKGSVWGGGFADIWKGSLSEKPVCLKVLRFFVTETDRERLKKDFFHEALIWRQLRHANILPFLGISDELFAPSLCMISPWMANGNLIRFLEGNPLHDRFQSILEVVEGINYLHEFDPPIVHADLRGANILVTDNLTCCLADFGLSRVIETQVPGSSMILRGSIRWLPPEMMDYSLFKHAYFTAIDIYSFGCTIIEIYSGQPPFPHIKNEVAMINEVLTVKREHARPHGFDDDDLWSLVMTCLAFEPDARPSAGELCQSLYALRAARDATSTANGTGPDNEQTVIDGYQATTVQTFLLRGRKVALVLFSIGCVLLWTGSILYLRMKYLPRA
ncbi:kinase-like domain-containing protein [Mycena latifolia]|nr:kinase-like domain-containing protein [Mycena latifolia]